MVSSKKNPSGKLKHLAGTAPFSVGNTSWVRVYFHKTLTELTDNLPSKTEDGAFSRFQRFSLKHEFCVGQTKLHPGIKKKQRETLCMLCAWFLVSTAHGVHGIVFSHSQHPDKKLLSWPPHVKGYHKYIHPRDFCWTSPPGLADTPPSYETAGRSPGRTNG